MNPLPRRDNLLKIQPNLFESVSGFQDLQQTLPSLSLISLTKIRDPSTHPPTQLKSRKKNGKRRRLARERKERAQRPTFCCGFWSGFRSPKSRRFERFVWSIRTWPAATTFIQIVQWVAVNGPSLSRHRRPSSSSSNTSLDQFYRRSRRRRSITSATVLGNCICWFWEMGCGSSSSSSIRSCRLTSCCTKIGERDFLCRHSSGTTTSLLLLHWSTFALGDGFRCSIARRLIACWQPFLCVVPLGGSGFQQWTYSSSSSSVSAACSVEIEACRTAVFFELAVVVITLSSSSSSSICCSSRRMRRIEAEDATASVQDTAWLLLCARLGSCCRNYRPSAGTSFFLPVLRFSSRAGLLIHHGRRTLDGFEWHGLSFLGGMGISQSQWILGHECHFIGGCGI